MAFLNYFFYLANLLATAFVIYMIADIWRITRKNNRRQPKGADQNDT